VTTPRDDAELAETLRPDLVSWVESANDPATDFPIQNLPFGMFRDGAADPRPGIAIGDRVLDLVELDATGWFFGPPISECIARCVTEGSLNPLFGRGRAALAGMRRGVSTLLRAGFDGGTREQRASLLVPMSGMEMLVPARIGDYTDFYASINHASNVGSMFRPDNALLPNYKWVPIGYHGRASSVVASGAVVTRPSGQTRDDAAAPPAFGPSRRLDYELEVGAFIGAGNALGSPIPVAEAESHVAGLCLVNDWSARDIQTWEYQPLGPFLAKSFLTTVSPWVVTLDALAPFRAPAFTRADGDPAPLPYLHNEADQRAGGIDIRLEVLLASRRMRDAGMAPYRVSLGRFTSMYWTVAQLVAHHASNGCNLRPGDLLASGTVSGPEKESRGCLLERTWRGTEPLALPTGETRRFLEDGDEVIMRGWCERDGARRIGFGECRGIVGV
jgi:fumarylacetoacetase